jgi:hypothetical protein
MDAVRGLSENFDVTVSSSMTIEIELWILFEMKS